MHVGDRSQARLSEMESELDASRHEHRTFGSACAAKDRDATRRLAGLQDEVEQLSAQVKRAALRAGGTHGAAGWNLTSAWPLQVATMEDMLQQRGSALAEAKDKVRRLCGGLPCGGELTEV